MAVGKLVSVAATVALVSILSVFYSPEELQSISHTEDVQFIQPEFQDQIMELETIIKIETPTDEIEEKKESQSIVVEVESQNKSKIQTLDVDYLWPITQFQQQLMLAAEIIGIGLLLAWQISTRWKNKDSSPSIHS